jgi:hypothetical protein
VGVELGPASVVRLWLSLPKHIKQMTIHGIWRSHRQDRKDFMRRCPLHIQHALLSFCYESVPRLYSNYSVGWRYFVSKKCEAHCLWQRGRYFTEHARVILVGQRPLSLFCCRWPNLNHVLATNPCQRLLSN